MAGIKLVCIAVVCMVLASAAVDAVLTCQQVTTSLVPCLSFVRSRVGSVPSGCCAGVSNLNNMAKTTPDRQAACNCLKLLAGAFHDIDYNRVTSLPRWCGVSIPYKISPSTDCRSVK